MIISTFFIVDDEIPLHEIYREILEMNGHSVCGEAYNGQECIEIICQNKIDPDYIIMDHRMPIKNGLDTTKELLKEKPGLKIIFVSADISVEDDAFSAGAVGFLKKPFTIDDFIEDIELLSKDHGKNKYLI